MVMITLYARQKKRHRCIEQTFGLYGRRREWDDLRELFFLMCKNPQGPLLLHTCDFSGIMPFCVTFCSLGQHEKAWGAGGVIAP